MKRVLVEVRDGVTDCAMSAISVVEVPTYFVASVHGGPRLSSSH